MTRIVVACGVVLAVSSVFAGSPKIVCPEPTFDFGDRSVGEMVDAFFDLENQGDADLEIGEINLSCGCTKAEVALRTLPPGQKTRLTAKLDTSKKGHGEHRFSIRVHSNDPERPIYTLTLSGSIAHAFQVPSDLALGEIRVGEGKTATLRIQRLKDSNAEVRSVVASVPFITAAIARGPGADDGVYEIEVRVSGDAPIGLIDEVVSLRTSDPNQQQFNVRLSGKVLAEVETSISRIFFGSVSAKDQPSRDILVTQSFSQDGQDLKVLEATAGGKHLLVAVETVQEGRQYRVRVKVKPDTPPGTLIDRITITTNKVHDKTVEIPVYGLIGK
jgi:hypothetical protein